MPANPECEACDGKGVLDILGKSMPCSFCERVELPKPMLHGDWSGGCGFCSGSGMMIDPTNSVNLIPCVHCESPVKTCETCLGKGKIQDAHGAWYACTYCRPRLAGKANPFHNGMKPVPAKKATCGQCHGRGFFEFLDGQRFVCGDCQLVIGKPGCKRCGGSGRLKSMPKGSTGHHPTCPSCARMPGCSDCGGKRYVNRAGRPPERCKSCFIEADENLNDIAPTISGRAGGMSLDPVEDVFPDFKYKPANDDRPKPPPDLNSVRPRVTVFLTDKDGFKIETTIWLDVLPASLPVPRRDRLAVELFAACAGELNGAVKLNAAGKKIVEQSIEGMFPEISPEG